MTPGLRKNGVGAWTPKRVWRLRLLDLREEGLGTQTLGSGNGEPDAGILRSQGLTTPARSHWLRLRPQRPRAGTDCPALEPRAWPAARPGWASRVRSSPPPVASSATLPEKRPGAQSPRAVADLSLRGRARQPGTSPTPHVAPPLPRSSAPPAPFRKK